MRFLEEAEMSAEAFADLVQASADDHTLVTKMQEYLDKKKGQ
jgi:hypothetical protein